MNFEYKLSEKIERLSLDRVSAKEVAMGFGMHSKFEIEEVTRVLDGMATEGKIERSQDGKYTRKAASTDGFKGVLRGNKRGFAFLIREDGGDDLFIPNKGLGGAMHGDTVIAKIVRGDEAKVTSILVRGISRLVGVFKKTREFGFCIPDGNNYYKDVYVSGKNTMGAADNCKVVVEIIGYGESPEGKITEIIGDADLKQSEVLSILKSHDFYNFFDEKTEQEAKFKQYQPVEDRVSYVDMLTVTIDGEDSKDLDDAISLFKTKGGYKLYVHIADVSHYVERGSALDDEAFKRCTSVYFPGNVYPMLPKILSNGLCSLNPGEDRLTLTAVITLDNTGAVSHTEVTKSIINNDCRMTYKQVTAIIEGDKAEMDKVPAVLGMIRDMYDLSRLLQAKRQERGNINFDTKESKIILDAEGNVDKIEAYPYTVANEIIEEFMLLANESVAKIVADKELPFVYRVHEKPDPEKMTAFREFAGALGYVLPVVEEITPKMLQELLTKIEGNPLEPVISKVMLRSMKKAKYEVECHGHFGLAAEYYCHFTSPIRRYPDLQIHRVIKDMLDDNLGNIPKLAKWCKEVADTSSERERAAELAEREIDDFYKTEYMLRHVGEVFEGIVSGVTGFGVFVELNNTCEGLARLENLPQDTYTFVEERFRLQGAYHAYTLGQSVKIEVMDCDLDTRKVSFSVVEEDVDGVRKPLGGESSEKSDRPKKTFGGRPGGGKPGAGKPSGGGYQGKSGNKPGASSSGAGKTSGGVHKGKDGGYSKSYGNKPGGAKPYNDMPRAGSPGAGSPGAGKTSGGTASGGQSGNIGDKPYKKKEGQTNSQGGGNDMAFGEFNRNGGGAKGAGAGGSAKPNGNGGYPKGGFSNKASGGTPSRGGAGNRPGTGKPNGGHATKNK